VQRVDPLLGEPGAFRREQVTIAMLRRGREQAEAATCSPCGSPYPRLPLATSRPEFSPTIVGGITLPLDLLAVPTETASGGSHG
jgi:hypothetical protein